MSSERESKIFSLTILSEANFRMVEKIFLNGEERVFQRSLEVRSHVSFSSRLVRIPEDLDGVNHLYAC